MSTLNHKPLVGTLLACFLLLTFWIRIQGVERIPEGQFTENDAYLYHWQANIIAEQGSLPVADEHRWLPRGRDNRQLLPVYPYAIAYIHKALPWFSLYHIQLYLPVFCFTLGLGVLFLLLTRTSGVAFASIVALLLATLPGSIERSAAGFGDRDAWYWMLGIFAVTCYLWKESMEPGRRRWIATALAGFTIFLGGLSWEGFGLFVLIILSAELWKFCTTDTEHHLKEYLLWILMFAPWLYLLAPAYRSGYSFTTHLAALTLLPPLSIFALRGVRHLLLHFYEPLRSHARELASVLTLLGFVAGTGYIFFHYSTFEITAFTVFENDLMKTVGELVDPHFKFWYRRYGAIFILGSIGWIGISLHLWKWRGLPLSLSLFLFTTTTFLREPITNWIGNSTCDMLFLISLGITTVSLCIACRRKKHAKNELITLITLVWFLLWVALSRGGKRYDFFIGIPLAYGTAGLLWQLPVALIQNLFPQKRKLQWVLPCVTTAGLISVLFLNPLGGHITRSSYAAAQMRKPTPGQGTPLEKTLTWMKTALPPDSIVAADWGYGSQLNIFGGVKTIMDQDHFLPHWIYLYYRHVFCAQDTREALEFLKTHKATYLMLTAHSVMSRTHDFSSIGSDNNDRRFGHIPLLLLSDKRLSRIKQTPFLYIEPIDIASPPDFLTAHLKNGNIARLPYVVFQGTQSHAYKTSMDDNLHGGIIFHYDENGYFKKADYLPALGWNSLAIRLYFRGELPDIFVPVYPTNGDNTADFKVWKINYPPDIKADDKYLDTEPKAKSR